MKKINLFFTVLTAVIFTLILSVGAYAATLGDIDGDGKIAAADARTALRVSVGLEKIAAGSEKFTVADVDFDDKITAADARLILRAAVGLEQLKAAHTHSYGAWQTEKKGSALTGKHYRVCACGAKETASCAFGKWQPEKDGSTLTGRHYRVCAVCGAKETADCAFGSWTETSAATCTSAQVLTRSCSVCGTKATKPGALKLGHIKGARVDSKSTYASCTTRGIEVFNCTRCKKDYVEYTNALGHSFTNTAVKSDKTVITAPTCTADGVYYYTCSRCGLSAKGVDESKRYTASGTALGHLTQLAESELGKNVKLPACLRCGKEVDNSADTFNKLVNRIKATDRYAYDAQLRAYKYPVSYLSKSTMKSTCEHYNGFIDSLGINHSHSIKSLFDDEMTGDDTSYTALLENVSPACIPIRSEYNTVSRLEEGDAVIKSEIVKGFSLAAALANIPDSYTVGSNEFSTTAYKTKAVSGNVLKITVKLKSENLFDAKKQLTVPMDKMTALQKLTGSDIRSELNGFDENYSITEEEKAEGLEMRMTMTLKQITSSADATFWFDAETLAPLAIVYNTDIVMSQDVYIYIKLAIELDGTMDPVVDTKTTSVYIFPENFD